MALSIIQGLGTFGGVLSLRHMHFERSCNIGDHLLGRPLGLPQQLGLCFSDIQTSPKIYWCQLINGHGSKARNPREHPNAH